MASQMRLWQQLLRPSTNHLNASILSSVTSLAWTLISYQHSTRIEMMVTRGMKLRGTSLDIQNKSNNLKKAYDSAGISYDKKANVNIPAFFVFVGKDGVESKYTYVES